jgi:hypothetical protein
MTHDQLLDELVQTAEWIVEHVAVLEADLPHDGEGLTILPQGIDGDALRLLNSISSRLTRLVYHARND